MAKASTPGSGRRRARVASLQALYRAEVVGDDLGAVSAELLADDSLPEDVRDYARRLVDLVVTHQSDIDRLLAEVLTHWDLDRVAVVDRCVLRIGAGELLYEPEVPARVILDEAIEIAKQFGSADSGRFVNGVLDKIVRVHRGEETEPA